MSSVNNSAFKKYFHKNGRAMGSMGYFLLLMIVFLIGAPEAWIRPNLHQSVFVMMPTLIFLICGLLSIKKFSAETCASARSITCI